MSKPFYPSKGRACSAQVSLRDATVEPVLLAADRCEVFTRLPVE
jgi:hypothetical protein